jgi:hypothetical protein
MDVSLICYIVLEIEVSLEFLIIKFQNQSIPVIWFSFHVYVNKNELTVATRLQSLDEKQ